MGMYTEKTEISYDDYLKLEGLLVIGHEASRRADDVARAVAGILGEDDPATGERPGHSFDAVVEGYGARELLRKSGITVLPPEAASG